MGKKLILLFFILFSIKVYSNNNTVKNNFDWSRVINAIIQVESKGNEKAVSKCGNCIGVMQIKKIVVDDCNEYLKMKKNKKRYFYNDRYNKEKSKEMFLLMQERYNKNNNIEYAIKMWNGGCNYKKNTKCHKRVNEYYNKVMKEYNKIKS